MYDFHTHTFLSDGVLSPIELIRRAYVRGLQGHRRHGPRGLRQSGVRGEDAGRRLRQGLTSRWDILAIPGVEITHVPKEDIDMAAREAKAMGARLVNVHGETVVEPVEPGTNAAAINSAYVDVLAHPGLLTVEEARMACRTGTFMEISARKGHSLKQRPRGQDRPFGEGIDDPGLGRPRARGPVDARTVLQRGPRGRPH